jgi:hypothetical protein
MQIPYNVAAAFKLTAIVHRELCGDLPAKVVSWRSESNQGWMSPEPINYLHTSLIWQTFIICTWSRRPPEPAGEVDILPLLFHASPHSSSICAIIFSMSCIRRPVATALCLAVLSFILAGLAFAGPHSHKFYVRLCNDSSSFPFLNTNVKNELHLAPSNVKRDTTRPAPISHVLETCLYVRNMNTSVKFYKEVLGLSNFMTTVRTI